MARLVRFHQSFGLECSQMVAHGNGGDLGLLGQIGNGTLTPSAQGSENGLPGIPFSICFHLPGILALDGSFVNM
jgi:hypothetical protein